MSIIRYSCMDTRWGSVHLAADDRGLVASSLFGARRDDLRGKVDDGVELVADDKHQHTGPYRRWLCDYLDRQVDRCRLPLFPRGTTFQRAVWDEMLRIPFGQTASYGDIAAQLDKPGAARAVGNAAAANPIPIFIPCHRVIRSDKSPGGFGGGVQLKRRMLQHERADIP